MPPRPPYDRWYPDSPIDGTFGYDLDGLLSVRPADEPEGFARLWREWYAAARTAPADAVLEPLGRAGAHDVSRVTFTAADGLRLRGWVGLPATDLARVGIVHGHGYGGRDFPDLERVPADAAVIFPVARGLGALNAGLGAPPVNVEHVVHGIDDVGTYALGRCAVDLWHAGTALLEVLAETGADDVPLYHVGKSFGGGIAALAAPWDDRVVGATLVVPSFGQHDLRLAVRCLGSGEAVRRYVAEHPEAREVLRYSDASVAARHLRVPVRVEAAAWDTHVPPQGQLAIASAVPGPDDAPDGGLELEVYPAGHAWYPGLREDEAAAYAATHDHVRRAVERAARAVR
ncbi:acetylxylan esterase [Isoptericola sp. BMS4]|uniref:acetylxylan esterase n=1 Tax=Isoptericola sp. BMS4 TaxID=2527875 RepID=UPI0014241ADF|nr:acetylxylan esterase [Isoptericola sp. BMS4]